MKLTLIDWTLKRPSETFALYGNADSDLDAAERRIGLLEAHIALFAPDAPDVDDPYCIDCAKARARFYTHCVDCAPEPDTADASFGERYERARREKEGTR